MQYSRTNQGGSILAFVVVGVVLAVMVVGGVYLLRQRGEQARNTSQPTVGQTDTSKQNQPSSQSSDTNKDKNKSSDQKPQMTTPSTSSPSKTDANKSPSTQQSTPSATSQMPATGQVTPPSADQPTATKPNVATGTPLSTSDKLPVTGPLDTVLQLLAAGTLTALVVAYVRSRLQATPSL